MKSELKELREKVREQQEVIDKLNKQMKRQKWWNVYFAFSRR